MNIVKTIAATALMAVTGSASAATLLVAGPTAPTTLPSSFGYSFVGGAGAASLTFQVLGYNTLDGQNAFSGGTDFSDLFTITLNGTTAYSGHFVLGGIGNQNVLVAAPGTSTTATNNGLGAGGTLSVTTALTLVEGVNNLTFGYATPNPQAFGDESWSLASATVIGNAAAPAMPGVPEPATWAMMIVGFGLVGAASRRRSGVTVAA